MTIKYLGNLLLANLFAVALWGTNITSANYDAEKNVLTITFSDSIYTDKVLLGRLSFDDDNGGPKADVAFTGGTILTLLNGDTLTDRIEISLIYGGIIDRWTDADGNERDIWGNDLTLVKAVEALNMSSLTLIVRDGAFIDNNAEPFIDVDGNGIYSPAEHFNDLNGNGVWDPAEVFVDANSNDTWDMAEEYIDANGNGVWDPAEAFTDDNSNGVWDDAELLFEDANGNGIWDTTEVFTDANGDGVWNPAEIFTDFDGDGIWFPAEVFVDLNGNGVWDNAENFTDLNGNSVWDSAEVYIDVNGNGVWDGAENFTDTNGNGTWDSTEVLITDWNGNGIWDPGEEFTDRIQYNGVWDPGEEYIDANGNGVWDDAEDFIDADGNGIWDSGESFTDANGNGIWDPAEDFYDEGLNGIWDTGEEFVDANDNGVYDAPDTYIDANSNGVWDTEEIFIDDNGNGVWDAAEPLTDNNGNSVWDDSESYIDANGNGIWDAAEPLTDTNDNDIWDAAENFTDENDNGVWDPAEELEDLNGNGVWDSTEVVGDTYTIGDEDGLWDPPEYFEDNNGNGVWDFEDFNDFGLGFPPVGANNGIWDFVDGNGNGICDSWFGPRAECEPWTEVYDNGLCDREFLDDINGNSTWDQGEGLIDRNGNNIWDAAENFSDVNGNDIWDPAEGFTDVNDNGVWDAAEEFTDTNGNDIWDPSEYLIDLDSDSVYDEFAEDFTDVNNNGIWDQFGVVSGTNIDVAVSGTEIYPSLASAEYDANINQLTLIFDRPVQFDQIPEDETFQNGPGDGKLNAGEDRNGNDSLDMEANIDVFKVGFKDGLGTAKKLEGLDHIIQTDDSDTIQIVLTRSDSKKLETTLDLSSLSMNISSGAFVDTLYNPSVASTLPAVSIEDSIPLLADSVTYNVSENKLIVFFRSKETNHRKIVTEPSPIYSKFSFSAGGSSINLSGIDGEPIVQDDIILHIKLTLANQKTLETMIDTMNAENFLYFSIEEYALYDENNNGNLEVLNLPVTITSVEDEIKQPPQIVAADIIYDAYTNILTLPWNIPVGFFNEVSIPKENEVSGNSNLEGIALYDPSNGSILTFDEGEVYYRISRNVTYLELGEEEAKYLENYPNRDNLYLTIDPYTFYSMTPHNNGNKDLPADSAYVVNYRGDKTAPVVTDVLFNTVDSTLVITLDELIKVSLLYPQKLSFGGIRINGDLALDSTAQQVSNFSVKLTSVVFDSIINLADSVKINPQFKSDAGAFVNLDGTVSNWIDQAANFGRYFWISSFEAFAPPPEKRFAALRSVGVNCDIYVDNDVWETKIDAGDLNAIVTAFDSIAPNDTSQGIADIVRGFVGQSEKDTDNNGKVIFVFTDILDEYGEGRNDTKSSLFVHGYSTMADTSTLSPYSNHGDIIYFDVDPMGREVYDDDEFEPDLSATYNAITHEFTRMVMMHNKPDQENWVIEATGTMMQKKAVGDVKFFGEGTNPVITPVNQLTYIATGYQSLKGRSDKFNVYLFLSYLQEKYSQDSTGWDIVEAIAQSDSVGISAVRDALTSLGYSKSVEDIFADYGLACYLDMIHGQFFQDSGGINPDSVIADTLYAGIYNFETFDLQTAPSGKSAALLKWDAPGGKGAPYTFKDIAPWSFNFIIMLGYSFDLAGNVNYLSPDLSATDQMVFDGYDGIDFRIKKLVMKGGFLEPMNPDYEVTDFVLDEKTSYGKLPVTTDSLFAFKDTLDNATFGVQIIMLMVAKTDDKQPPATYDFVISNITTLPDFSDLYAYQNPGIQNYLDLYVVSQRRVFDASGNEGPLVEYISNSGDSGSVVLEELYSYGTGLVIYQNSYEITDEGTYLFVYQGQDQSGNLFDKDSLTIVIDYYNPGTASRLASKNVMFDLPAGGLKQPQFIVSGSVPPKQTVTIPSGFEMLGDIVMFGANDQKLHKSASVSFSFEGQEIDLSDLSIYQLYQGVWRHIGAEWNGSELTTETRALGQFAVLSGKHGFVDEELTLPDEFILNQNYPNPFNPTTTIDFSLPEPGYVRLSVYDILGREVALLEDGHLKAGRHKIRWDSRSQQGVPVASGVYFYKLTSGNFEQVRKMLLIK